MTDISFTFTGPMTIHIHVYPGAEPPVITAPVGADQARYIVSDVSAYPEPPAPDLPSLVPAEPLDAAPPAAPASEPVGGPLSAVIPKSPRAGVRKVCPICGKPISKKAAACHHHRGVVARLLAAGAPRASWPTATPAQPIPAPAPPIPALADPARTAVEELPPPAPVDPPPPVSDPAVDPPAEPARRSRLPDWLRNRLPTARPGDRTAAAADEGYTELDLTELHGSRIA